MEADALPEELVCSGASVAAYANEKKDVGILEFVWHCQTSNVSCGIVHGTQGTQIANISCVKSGGLFK